MGEEHTSSSHYCTPHTGSEPLLTLSGPRSKTLQRGPPTSPVSLESAWFDTSVRPHFSLHLCTLFLLCVKLPNYTHFEAFISHPRLQQSSLVQRSFLLKLLLFFGPSTCLKRKKNKAAARRSQKGKTTSRLAVLITNLGESTYLWCVWFPEPRVIATVSWNVK